MNKGPVGNVNAAFPVDQLCWRRVTPAPKAPQMADAQETRLKPKASGKTGGRRLTDSGVGSGRPGPGDE